MKRILSLIAYVALAACATVGTPGQTLFEAFGAYRLALGAAADYAQTPTANHALVVAMNDANQSPAVQTTVTAARAYVLCRGSNMAVVAGVDCAAQDFRPTTLSGYAITLRNIAAKLSER